MAKLLSEHLRTQWCKGCGYCVKFCPRGALQIGRELNQTGYRHVVLNEQLCISCGICRTVCPDCVFVFTEEKGETV